MTRKGQRARVADYVGHLGRRILALADEPTDSDDVRLRKRVAVGAGYILVVLPLQLPFLGQGLALGWLMAATMPLIGVVNLIVLARTRRFARYVGVLVLMVLVLPAFVEVATRIRAAVCRGSPIRVTRQVDAGLFGPTPSPGLRLTIGA